MAGGIQSVHDVLVRMNCRNRAQAVALATRRGLI